MGLPQWLEADLQGVVWAHVTDVNSAHWYGKFLWDTESGSWLYFTRFMGV